MYKNILFDLDGTLTDSSEGITKCAQLALTHFNKGDFTKDELRVFIGPPLRETFVKFGIDEKDVDEAITVFRSRYSTVGKFENIPFDGIEELLQKLKAEGFKLYIATSKPETMAIDILEHFHLAHYFELIAGATMNAAREKKEDVLKYLLEQIDNEHLVMIGDTIFDVIGANQLNIPTIGVSWGFGDAQEMIDAGAVTIVNTPEELYQYIVKEK